MHIIHKTHPTYKYDYTDNFDTQFRPLPEIVAYDAYFFESRSGFDPYWDKEIYDQDKLEYKDTYNKSNDQIECDDLITDAHVSDGIYTDPNAIDFDDSHTQGPDTVIVPRSYFHGPSYGQNKEIYPISDPSVSQTPKPKLNG